MKELICKTADLTELVEKITWSGDTKQVARLLTFSLISSSSDPHLQQATINEGDIVYMRENGVILFGGPVIDIDKAASGNTTNYTATDLMFYINKSDISRIFDATPEVITAQICEELDIPLGHTAQTGVRVYMPCLGKKAYEAIVTAYTAASRQTGVPYIPLMQEVNKLCVIEKGQFSGVVLEGESNLINASYKGSIQNLVSRVLITDKAGNVVNHVDGSAQYGLVQVKYQQEDGVNAQVVASSMLKDVEKTGSVTAISDTRAVSGYSLLVKEPLTGLYGRFYIESDQHTFENGKEEMSLSLAFENIMDEREIEKTKGG